MQRWLGRILLIVAVAALVAAVVVWGGDGRQVAPQGESLVEGLEINATDIEGRPFSLEALRGKVVVVNLFATWCPPCRAETPALVELYETHHDDGLRAVMISAELSPDVRKFAEYYDVPFPVVAGAEAVFNRLSVRSIPQTYLVDRGGNVRLHVVGADVKRIEQGVRQLLAESPTGG